MQYLLTEASIQGGMVQYLLTEASIQGGIGAVSPNRGKYTRRYWCSIS